MKRKIWDKKTPLALQNGMIFQNAEEMASWTKDNGSKPFAFVNMPNMDVVIIEERGFLIECSPITSFMSELESAGVDPSNMSGEEILTALEELKNNQPAPEPSAEERIAAAMEYDNLMKY